MKKHLLKVVTKHKPTHLTKNDENHTRWFIIQVIVVIFALSVIANSIAVIWLGVKYEDLKEQYAMASTTHDEFNSTLGELDDTHQDIVSDIDAIIGDIDSLKESSESSTDTSKVSIASEVPEPMVELNLTNIAESSNIDAETFNQIIDTYLNNSGISNSKLKDAGEALVKMEEEYNINGLFCLAVCGLESGSGTSSGARNSNNLFGLMANSGNLMRFDSVEDCILYWGKLIRNNYVDYGMTTIGSIQGKYCPGSTSWAGDVSWFFNMYADMCKN